MNIIYSQQTTTLIPRLHGVSGIVRTGETQAFRNYMTVLWLHMQRDLAETELAKAVEQLNGKANHEDIYTPQVYRFQVGLGRWLREAAAIHAIRDCKVGLVWRQEFRFVMCMGYETEKALKAVFGGKR